MNSPPVDLVMLVVQSAIALAGFIGAFMISKLVGAIDGLRVQDGVLNDRLTQHREETLKDFARTDQVENMKRDVLGRVDRLEASLVTQLTAIEARSEQRYIEIRKDGRRHS